MRLLIAITSLLLFAHEKAQATFTINFSIPDTGNIASGFANAEGTPTNGMSWGILISTTDSIFSPGAYDPFIPTEAGTFLMVDGVQTDDYFVLSSNVTEDFSAFTEGDGLTPGGAGTITSINDVPFGSNGISQGALFALVWLPSNSAGFGDSYGFLTDPVFLVPSNGSDIDYDAPFEGADPVRLATFTIVPEPTTSLLLLLGLVLPIFRRHR